VNRRTVARVGIWLMFGFVVLIAVLLAFHRIPPLLGVSCSASAVVSIAGFRYYLGHTEAPR
jgi:hypothetical protein